MDLLRRGRGIPRAPAPRDSGSIGIRTGVTTVGNVGSALGKGQEGGGIRGKTSGIIQRVWETSPTCPWGGEEGRILTLPSARKSSGMPQGPGETQSPGSLGADSFPKAGSPCLQVRNPSCSISPGSPHGILGLYWDCLGSLEGNSQKKKTKPTQFYSFWKCSAELQAELQQEPAATSQDPCEARDSQNLQFLPQAVGSNPSSQSRCAEQLWLSLSQRRQKWAERREIRAPRARRELQSPGDMIKA